MEGVKVCIRTRPMIKREAGCENQWDCDTQQIRLRSVKDKQKLYLYDRVFSDDETTSDVYEEIAEPIIESAMKGFNGTIFAYGQTSSGKTYTMMGTQTNPGIIPLAVNEIFSMIEKTPEREFLLRVSYLEIYNENLKDLLATETTTLSIREDEFKTVIVHGLLEEMVTSPSDVITLMEKGERNRQMAATNMNERSSRSHTIFRMIIESRERGELNRTQEEAELAVKVSHLNLVDLAGSERASQTGAEGQRLKEGCYINKSLMILGQVINQICKESELTSGTVFKSFRDSKLTRILQSSLGGNSLTAIICTVTLAVVDETESTLRFASSAKKVTNKPIMNEVLSDEALLIRQKREINKLKKKIQEMERQKGQQGCVDNLLAEKDLLQEKNLKLTRMLLVSSLPPDYAKRQQKMRRETWCPGARTNPLQVGWHATPPKLDVLKNETLLADFSVNQSTFISDLEVDERSRMFETPHIPASKRVINSDEPKYVTKKMRFLESNNEVEELKEKLQLTEKILDDVKVSKEVLKQERNELLEKVAELEVDLEDIKIEKGQDHGNVETKLQIHNSQLQGQIKMLESAINESLSEQALHEEEKSKLRATIEKLSDQVVTLERREIERSNSNTHVNGLKSQVEDLECQLRNACHEKRCLQEQYDDETDRSYNLSLSVEKLGKELVEIKSESDVKLMDYKERVSLLQTQLEASLSATKSPDYSAKLESEIATLKLALQTKNENADELQKEIAHLQYDMKNSTRKFEETIEDLKAELKVAKESPKQDSAFVDVMPQPSFSEEKIKCLEEAIQHCELLIEEKCTLEVKNQDLYKECSEKENNIETLKQRTLSQETKINELLEQAEFDRTEKQVMFEEEKNWTKKICELEEKLKLLQDKSPDNKHVKALETKIVDFERNSADAQLLLQDSNQKLSQALSEVTVLKECKDKLEKELELKQADLESYMSMLDISKPTHYTPMQRSFVEATDTENTSEQLQSSLLEIGQLKLKVDEMEVQLCSDKHEHVNNIKLLEEELETKKMQCNEFEVYKSSSEKKIAELVSEQEDNLQQLNSLQIIIETLQNNSSVDELTGKLGASESEVEDLKQKLQNFEEQSALHQQDQQTEIQKNVTEQIDTIKMLEEELQIKSTLCDELKELSSSHQKKVEELLSTKEHHLQQICTLQNQLEQQQEYFEENTSKQLQSSLLEIGQLKVKVEEMEVQLCSDKLEHVNNIKLLEEELETKKMQCNEFEVYKASSEMKIAELVSEQEDNFQQLNSLQVIIETLQNNSSVDELTGKLGASESEVEDLKQKLQNFEEQSALHQQDQQTEILKNVTEQIDTIKMLEEELQIKSTLCDELKELSSSHQKKVEELLSTKEHHLQQICTLQNQLEQQQEYFEENTSEQLQSSLLEIGQLKVKVEEMEVQLCSDKHEHVNNIKLLEEELETKKMQCNEFEVYKSSSEKKIAELVSEQEDNLQQLNSLQIIIETLQNNSSVDELTGKLGASESEVEDLKQKLQNFEEQSALHQQDKQTEIQKNVTEQIDTIKMLEEELQIKSTLCDELKELSSSHQKKVEELLSTKEHHLQQICTLQNQLEQQQEYFEETCKAMEKEQENLKSKATDVNDSSTHVDPKLDKTNQHISELSKKLDEAKEKLEVEQRRHGELLGSVQTQQESFKEKEETIQSLQQIIDDLKSENEQMCLQLVESSQECLGEDKVQELETQILQQQSQINANNKFHAELEKEKCKLEEDLELQQVLVHELTSENGTLEDVVAESKDKIASDESLLKNRETRINELEAKCETLQTSILALKNDPALKLFEELKIKHAELETNMNSIVDDLNSKISQKNIFIDELQNKLSTVKNEVEVSKEKIDEMTHPVSCVKSEYLSTQEKPEISHSELECLVTELKHMNAKLEAQLQEMENEHSAAIMSMGETLQTQLDKSRNLKSDYEDACQELQRKNAKITELQESLGALQKEIKPFNENNNFEQEELEKVRNMEKEIICLNQFLSVEKKLVNDKNVELEKKGLLLEEAMAQVEKLSVEVLNQASSEKEDHTKCERQISDLKDLLDVSDLELRRSQGDREHLTKLLQEQESEMAKLKMNQNLEGSTLSELIENKEQALKNITLEKESLCESVELLTQKLTSLEGELKSEKENCLDFKSQVADMERCMSNDKAALLKTLQDQKHLSDAEKNFLVLYEEFSNLSAKCTSLEDDLHCAQSNSETLAGNLAEKVQQLDQMHHDIEILTNEKNDLADQKMNLEDSQKDLIELQAKADSLIKDLNSCKNDLNEKNEIILKIQQNLEIKEQQLQKVIQELQSKEKEIVALSGLHHSIEDEKIHKAKQIKDLKNKCDELEPLKEEIKILKQSFVEEIAALKTEHSSTVVQKEQVNLEVCKELEALKKKIAKDEEASRKEKENLMKWKEKMEMEMQKEETEKQTLLENIDKLQSMLKDKELQIVEFKKKLEMQHSEFQSEINRAIEISKEETNKYIKMEEERLNKQLHQQVEMFSKYKHDFEAKSEECVNLQKKLMELEKNVNIELEQKPTTSQGGQNSEEISKYKKDLEAKTQECVELESKLAKREENVKFCQRKLGELKLEYYEVCKEVDDFEEETAQLKEKIKTCEQERDKLQGELQLMRDVIPLQQSSQIQLIAQREEALKLEEAKVKEKKEEIEKKVATVKENEELKSKIEARSTDVLALENKIKFLQKEINKYRTTEFQQRNENQNLTDTNKSLKMYVTKAQQKLKTIDQNIPSDDVGVQTDVAKSSILPGGFVQLTKLDIQEMEMKKLRNTQKYLEKELAKYKNIEHVRRGENQQLLDENKSLRTYVVKAKHKLKEVVGPNFSLPSHDVSVQTEMSTADSPEDSPGNCKSQ